MRKVFFLLVFATICMTNMAQSSSNSYCPNSNHPHIIDLGIGVKWSCCNVGADAPHKYGGYYAWGETKERSNYDREFYRYCHGSNFDNIGTDIGGTRYDVAAKNWGDRWRMPTIEEFEKLKNKCSHRVVTFNGIRGMKFTGPNGKSIFMPFGGLYITDDLRGRGNSGDYWSSCVWNNNATDWSGEKFSIYEDGNKVEFGGWFRQYGLNVRPVYD